MTFLMYIVTNPYGLKIVANGFKDNIIIRKLFLVVVFLSINLKMKTTLLLVLVLVLFVSCSRHGIVKTYAYARKSVAGTVRTDNNGKQINSGITVQHLLFIETDSSKGSPGWGTTWIDGSPFSVQPVKISNHKQVIGKTMEGQEVSIAVKKGHELWQLMLSPKQDSLVDIDLQQKIKQAKILLSGTWKDKPFTYKISKEEELERLEFQ